MITSNVDSELLGRQKDRYVISKYNKILITESKGWVDNVHYIKLFGQSYTYEIFHNKMCVCGGRDEFTISFAERLI